MRSPVSGGCVVTSHRIACCSRFSASYRFSAGSVARRLLSTQQPLAGPPDGSITNSWDSVNAGRLISAQRKAIFTCFSCVWKSTTLSKTSPSLSLWRCSHRLRFLRRMWPWPIEQHPWIAFRPPPPLWQRGNAFTSIVTSSVCGVVCCIKLSPDDNIAPDSSLKANLHWGRARRNPLIVLLRRVILRSCTPRHGNAWAQ